MAPYRSKLPIAHGSAQGGRGDLELERTSGVLGEPSQHLQRVKMTVSALLSVVANLVGLHGTVYRKPVINRFGNSLLSILWQDEHDVDEGDVTTYSQTETRLNLEPLSGALLFINPVALRRDVFVGGDKEDHLQEVGR